MRVHDVEPMVARQTDEGGSERKQVLRLAEQRIRRRLDPLEREAWNARPPSERLVAADQVDLVAAARERMGQFGGDDAAAAERGVADDPDVHGTCFKRVVRTSGSFTTTPSAKRTPASAPNCASRLSISKRNVGAVSRVCTALSSSGGANWLA